MEYTIADPQWSRFERVMDDFHPAYQLSKRIIRSPKISIGDVKRYAVKANVVQAGTAEAAAVMWKEYPGPEVLNLQAAPTLTSIPHFNVLLPAVGVKYMSGGPNTAVSLAYRMATKGIPIRFVSTGLPLDEDPEPMWRHIESLTGIKKRIPHVKMVSGHDRSQPLWLGENDVFFATAWWTTQMADHGLAITRPKKFIYIIQEFEPGLYNWSTDYALALDTYEMNYAAILNSQLLADFFNQNKVGRFPTPGFFESSAVLDIAVDGTKFYFQARTAKREKREWCLSSAEPGST